MASPSTTLRRLGPGDVSVSRELSVLFGDRETYEAEPPTGAYPECLLGKQHVIVLVALAGEGVSGGPVAHELDTFERTRRESYTYDLATAAGHRRRRVGTAPVERLREIAAERGA